MVRITGGGEGWGCRFTARDGAEQGHMLDATLPEIGFMGAERGDDFVAVHGENIAPPRPDRQFITGTRLRDPAIGKDRSHTRHGADSAA